MRNCRNYNRDQFFLFEICIHYLWYREFSSPTWKKSPPPKVPIPTKNPPLPPITERGGGGVRTMLGLLIFSPKLLILQLLLLSEFLDFSNSSNYFFSIYSACAISSAILILSSNALFSLDDLLLVLLLDVPEVLWEEAFVDTDHLEPSWLCMSLCLSIFYPAM